jgi:membrane-associated phospholipid phosphatase
MAAASALGVALTYVFFVGTSAGRNADRFFFEHGYVGEWEHAANELVGALNVVTVPLAAVVIAVVALRVRGPAAALGTLMLIVGASLTAEALKALLGTLDPLEGESRRVLGRHFYPSGHAALTMSLCLAAILAAPSRRRLQVTLVVAGAPMVMGGAILVTGSHHLSDVLGGFLVAAGWAAACSHFVRGS